MELVRPSEVTLSSSYLKGKGPVAGLPGVGVAGYGTCGLQPLLVSALPASLDPETPATALPSCLFPEWGRGSHLAVWNLGKASGDVTVSQTDLKPILILASLTLTPTPRGTHCCQFMILMGILAYKLGWFPFCAVSLGFNFLSIFSGRLGKLPLI